MVSSTSKPPTEKEKISGLHYFSPELIYAKQPGRFSRSDVWALGCIAITMMTGNL
jgi:serine/threonine protein kinase